MERDYGQELDQLREQMEALRQEMATQVERLREEAQASLPNQPIMERLGRVCLLYTSDAATRSAV